ncbi:hypothetical protein O6H91_14G025400 [Diphasiastrum complanatum]|uniref:Uncharacterized protein n=1 Tax=Diphasiastrum complanatum TaxID=34168 RepID=A0ACC2BME5_DIPCM|nr:hypothetical protein O6H91_14G025400 [Diphasiastrum complanatum]
MNRMRQSNFLSPASFGASDMEEIQQLQSAVTAGASNQFRLFGTIAAANPVQSTLNGKIDENDADLGCTYVATRKRTRESDDLFTAQRRQQFINLGDFPQNHPSTVLIPPSNGISMRLALDDNRINSTATSTSNRGESINFLSLLSEDIASQLQQQKDEIDHYIKAQGEQMRQIIEEKRQQHLTALLAAVEERMLKRLREKALEVEKVSRKNRELEDRIKQLSVEAHLWQKQAKSNEAMVTALRCNLQQAVALSREQSKEGCGDSEDDDAASSHHDNLADAHARAFKENRELKEQKTCRVCRCNDVSILLLPCRHLCLCKDCETRLDACPVCRSMKNASVQVYMA